MGCCSSPRSTIAGVGILHLMVALGCLGLCGYLLTLDGASLEMVLMDSWILLTTMHLPVIVDTKGNVIDRDNAAAARDRDVAYRTNDSKSLHIQGRSAQDIVDVVVHDDGAAVKEVVTENRHTSIDSVLASAYADYDNVSTSIEFDDVTVVNRISNDSYLEDLSVVNGSEDSYNISNIDGMIINETEESSFHFNESLIISTNREEESHAESVSGTLVNETLSLGDEVIVNATELNGHYHESNLSSPNLTSNRFFLRDRATSDETTEGVTGASSNDTVIVSTSLEEVNNTAVATNSNVSTVTSDVPSDYTENDVDYTSVMYVEEPQHNVTEINLSNEEPHANVTEIHWSNDEPQHNETETNMSSEEPQHNVTEINLSTDTYGSMLEHQGETALDEDEIQPTVDGNFEQTVTEQSITPVQTTPEESHNVGRNYSLTDAVSSRAHSVSVDNTSLVESLLFEEVVLRQHVTRSDQLEPPLVAITTTPPPAEETPANSSADEGIAVAASHFSSADDDDESNARIASTEYETASEQSLSTEESRPDVGALTTDMTTSEEAVPNVSVHTTVLSTHVEAAPSGSGQTTVLSASEEAASNVGAVATVLPTPMEESANMGALPTVVPTPDALTLLFSSSGFLSTIASAIATSVLDSTSETSPSGSHSTTSSPTTFSNVIDQETLPSPTLSSPSPVETAGSTPPSENVTELAEPLPSASALRMVDDASLSSEESRPDVGALTTVPPTPDALTLLVGSSGFLSSIASAVATSVLDSTSETSPSGSHSTPSSPTTFSNVIDQETLPSPTLAEPLPSASALRLEDDARYSMLTSNGSHSVHYGNGNVRFVNTTVEGITLPPIITTTGFITTILANPITDDSGLEVDAELVHLVRQLQLGLAVLAVMWFAIVCTIASLLLLFAAIMSVPALVVPWLVVQWVSVLGAIAGVGILTWRLVVAGVALWCWWLVVLSIAGVVVLVLCLVLVMEAHQTMPSNEARQQDAQDSYEMRYITEK